MEDQLKAGKKLYRQILPVVLVAGLLVVVGVMLQKQSGKEINFNKVKTQQPSVVIGWVGPLTGDGASYGESLKSAIELARKDMPNPNISMVYEDARCDTKLAVSAVTKLINQNSASAIIADLCASPVPLVPLIEQNQVVLMSSIVTIREYSGISGYAFRVIPSDEQQGKVLAKQIKDRGFKTLAILYSNEEYGRGLESSIRENFIQLGGRVVASESMPLESKDVNTQLTKIKQADPDSLFVVGLPGGVAAALKQARQLGLNIQFFGPEALKGQEIIDNAEGAAEGLIITSVTVGSDDFAKRYREYYGKEPGPYAAQGYDAYLALAHALAKGARSGPEIRDALKSLEFDGVTGHIKFEQDGNIKGSYNIYQVRKSKFEQIPSL